MTIDSATPPHGTPGSPPVDSRRFLPKLDVVGLAVLFIPMTAPLEISLVGRLFTPEILLAALLPFLLMTRGHRLLKPLPAIFLMLLSVWLIGQIATDLWRDTPSNDYLRGWARIGFTMASFASIFLLIGDRRERVFWFGLGAVAGSLLDAYLAPSIYAEKDFWKFGIGSPLTWLGFYCALFAHRFTAAPSWLWPPVVAFGLGLLNLYMGARSFGGVCLVTGAYLTLRWHGSRPRSRLRRARPLSVALMGLGILLFGLAVTETYSYAARSGVMGEAAARKYRFQGVGQFGILLGGRQEIFISARAITEKPILGHGSWAKDPELRYHYALFALRVALGYPTNEYVANDLLPTHSHLFGAWAEAGILGAFLWIWVGTLALRNLLELFRSQEPLAPLLAFISILLLWDILFSPFGAERRFITPFYVVTMMWFLNQTRWLEPTGSRHA